MRSLLAMCVVVLSCAAAADAQTVSCESFNGAYRECRVASSGKIRLVMEISDRACFEDLTWGTRSIGIVWVRRGCRATFTVSGPGSPNFRSSKVVCESLQGVVERCPADTSFGVVVARQLSKAACTEGLSWGLDPDDEYVWVDRGCRAEFLVGPKTEPIPDPPLLDSVVVCESDDGRRRNCKADTTGGVQIVRSLNDSACRYGREWGYDASGIWVAKGCRAEFVVRGKPKPMLQTVTCESPDQARKACPADTRFGVAIARQLSEWDCIHGETWGFDETGVWVTKGCRAQFALGGYRLPPEAVPPTAEKVSCESLDGVQKQCAVDTSRGVGLIRQLGDSDCVLNRTWGYDSEGIWVTSGCRAEFAVAR
ncbi:MAG: DUF3011 domain-containing protein [Acidobacteriota bacterium]|nr:DUF3011 domain-containing protein [Acidobacteriota bacterium]